VHKTREIPSSTTATLKRLKEFTLSKINDHLPAQLVMSVKWEQGLYHLCYYYFGLQLRTKVPVTFHPITVAIQPNSQTQFLDPTQSREICTKQKL